MSEKTIIQVLGPTGAGKSKVSVQLAAALGGEIISADSMQVYNEFDIGTDKITPAKMKGIPHHLIDILSDSSQFNTSIFMEKSFEAAEDITNRGGVPVVCGGTALYLRIMMKGIFPESKQKRISREQ
ncbi:MAG: tRNA (adenosine(37)-N6)-dimethylallyltransferase MiaA, partial [bacterium]|nr:tRNA (adenosine(37)-N6)-dimethylallyltransferase MiaA [bacterium]